MPPLVTAALKLPVRRLGQPRWPVSPLTLYWAVFAVSIGAFLLDYSAAGRLPVLSTVLQVLAFVPCGFAWLFTRALFRQRTRGEWWPELIVAALFVSCLVLHLDRSGSEHGLVGYIGQIQGLLGTAILLLTFLEVLHGKVQTRRERRFRWLFGATYLGLIGVSLGFALPELAAYGDSARAVLASVALVGGTAAWRYRCHHPWQARPAREATRPALAARIERALQEHKAYLEPSLKVADLAALVGAPDYQVSQAIVRDLGYPNFNQLVNRYRLDAAKARLAAPEHAGESILAVAMDSGFASLGPFNRAFKQDTGVTPSQYRRAAIG